MIYQKDTCSVELSVRELCELAHMSGSIDTRFPRRRTTEREKTELRTKLPPEKGAYTENVPLRNTTVFGGISYTVEGIADGVIRADGEVTVEEISPARRRGAFGEDAYSRLRCYAYFLSAAEGLPHVRMRRRFVHSEGGEVEDALSVATAGELFDFYTSLLDRIAPYAAEEVKRHEERLPSVAGIKFPYRNPREGQTELAENTFRTIRRGGRLFAQAPTGIGKTMSVLYPSVKALGEGYCDRIFYLTAKGSTGKEAYAAAGKLFEAGAGLRTVMLHAKEQMCLCEGGCRTGARSHCNPVDCPYARGYYDRVEGALWGLLGAHSGFPRSAIMAAAREHRVCPHELSLDLSRYCEIIICDYNYVFDPAVYLRRYFDPDMGERGQYVFLVDEAHNLPDRARDMYSMRLEVAPFEAVYARIDPHVDSEAEEALGGFLIALHRLSALCTEHRTKHDDGSESGFYLNRAPLEKFGDVVRDTRGRLDRFLRSRPDHPLYDAIEELSAQLRRYLFLSECYDDRFITYLQLEKGKLTVQLYCLDPSSVLRTAMNRARAVVLFSATLTPTDYFADILGGDHHSLRLDLPSPYRPEQLAVAVATGVSTRMETREGSYRRVATLIAATVSAKAGNYIVYFPSYDYMQSVLAEFEKRYPAVPHIVQQRNMSPAERNDFLDYFRADEGKLRVGFCVLGGSFSEGVDLPGSRLIGAVVVGVGLPGLSNERNILRDYYENKCERGYDYAYTYPGMNRVLQAAGRVIRREEDYGVVVLIDARYAEEPYLHLYPAHWQGITAAANAKSLARHLQLFWEKAEQDANAAKKMQKKD